MINLQNIKKLQNYINSLESGKRHLISKVRQNNPDVPRKDFNQYLIHLARKNEVFLYEMEDPLQMTDETRNSSICFGGVLNHIIYNK